MDAGKQPDTAALYLRLQQLEAHVASMEAEGHLVLTAQWLLGSAVMVFFMQTGFALVECGSCRLKNALSILTKNQLDCMSGMIMWFCCGWAFAFGDAGSTHGWFGTTQFFGEAVVSGNVVAETAGNFFFQTMFCAVSATIVSGAIAERCSARGYILFSLLMTGFIYPVVACWCWNDKGWLKVLGFHDLAGSGAVHLTGGMGALCGAWSVGPRAGRFVSGDRHEFAPHNVPFIVMGTLILWVGWYGFSAGCVSNISSTEGVLRAALVSINTSISAVAGGCVASALRFVQLGRWDVPFTCNGILVGLVSITGPCDVVNPSGAALIGAVGGLLFASASLVMQQIRIDDPVDAFSVHGIGGMWGLVATWAFHRGSTVLGEKVDGPSLLVQVKGIIAISAYSGIACLSVFRLLSKCDISQQSLLQQRHGLDKKHVMGAYGNEEAFRYRALISHAKRSHGATARWFQLELAQCVGGKSLIFLDSDNLINLNTLLGTVRDRVDALVVLATDEVWWRPWCAAEITVASMSAVPIVLVRMPNVGQLDFVHISKTVRSAISLQQLETLAPFGIGYNDIEQAYARLQDAVQIPFGIGHPVHFPENFSLVAKHAELTPSIGHTWLRRPRRPAHAAGLQANCLGAVLHKSIRTFLLLCDLQDIEAIAAMHICETALNNMCQEQVDGVQVVCCSACTEFHTLELVHAGASIILILSQEVLSSSLVQRVCLVRAAIVWPGGDVLSVQSQGTAPSPDRAEDITEQIAVLVHADRLRFEYPDAAFYTELRNVLPLCESARQASPAGKKGIAISEFDRERKKFELPPASSEEAVSTLVNFYKALFSQIALTLSTHGSWRTIEHQCTWIYERALKVSNGEWDLSVQRHRTSTTVQSVSYANSSICNEV